MNNKISNKDALKFFEDNYIMIKSCEAPCENGCADKCRSILKKSCEESQDIENTKANLKKLLDNLHDLYQYTDYAATHLYVSIADNSIAANMLHIRETLKALTEITISN